MNSCLTGQDQRIIANEATSGWQPVISRVLQGSFFGPVLFNAIINDLDTGLVGIPCKFVNDTSIGGEAVDSLRGEEALQRDLLPFGCHSIERT